MERQLYMRIAELEKRSGVPRSTIHYYLREGLLPPPARTGHTMAYYDESHLERLKMIQDMKMSLRMPIDFIRRRIAELEQTGQPYVRKGIPAVQDGTPPPTPRENKKNDIIKTAIRIFSTQGYHQTKVMDITQAAGISTGTFYIYFKNKQDLFIEVIDDVIRTIIGSGEQAIREEKDFLKRTITRARIFYDNYTRYNEILIQLRAEMASDSEWAKDRIKKIYHELTAPLIREAQQAIEQGVIRQTDPDLLAYAMTGLIEIMSLRTTIDDAYTFDDIITFLQDLLINGLGFKTDSHGNTSPDIQHRHPG